MTKTIDISLIPTLPLEQLLVDALSAGDPGCRRVDADELFIIGHTHPKKRPNAPNIVCCENGDTPEESFMVMAGDGLRDFPAFKRTFLSPEQFAVVYVAERVEYYAPAEPYPIAVQKGESIREIIKIHYKSREFKDGQPTIELLELSANSNSNGVITRVRDLLKPWKQEKDEESRIVSCGQPNPLLNPKVKTELETMVPFFLLINDSIQKKQEKIRAVVSEEKYQQIMRINGQPYNPSSAINAVLEFIK